MNNKVNFWRGILFPNGIVDFDGVSDSGLVIPSGTTAQRPTSPVDGTIRFNTTLAATETFQNGAWGNSLIGGGEANTATNLGAGQPVFATKVGDNLQFRSIKAGTGIGIATGSNELIINYTGSGGGGGGSPYTTIVVTSGGTLDGTYTGTPTFSGNVAFTGAPDFSAVTNVAAIQTDLGLDAVGVKALYESNADTNAYTDTEQLLVAGINNGKRTVQITTTTPSNIGLAVPSGSIIEKVLVHVTTAYSVGATIIVGDAGTTNSIMASIEVDATTVGIYQTHPMTEFASLTQLIATIGGSPATGAARVVVSYFVP
jgi:hypothetical protein